MRMAKAPHVPMRAKLRKAVPLLKEKKPPPPSHPRFKRAKMSVMGKSAYGTPGGAGGPAFPGNAMAMGGGAAGGGAPMPANAQPDNIVQ